MSTVKKKLKIAGTLLLGLFLFCYVSVHLIVRSDSFRTRVQSELSARTGYEVRIDDLRLTPWLSVVASGVFVSKDGETFFQGERIVCFLAPYDFYFGTISRLSLEKPQLHLSLEDLFNPTGKTSPDLSIGALNIEEGEVVLETGRGEPFILRSIFLSAKNVNLSEQTGLQLHTYIPALSGSVALSMSGGPEEKQAEIVIHQADEKSPIRLLPKTGEEKAVLQARFRMKKTESHVYEVKGSGSADQFRWGPEKVNGQFDSLFQLDEKFKNLLLSVDLKMPQFPTKLLSTEFSISTGPVEVTLKGDYSASQKTLLLQKINVASSIGSLEGGGAVGLGEEPARLTTTLRLRDVALDSLKTLMPGWMNEFTYSGKIAADLNVSGPYNDPLVTGIAWNDGAKVVGKNISFAQLSLKIPFQWTRSSVQVKSGRFQGKDLVLGRKGETQFRFQEVSLLSELIKQQQKPLQMAGDFQILEGRFATSDDSKVGEHLNVKGRFTCENCDGDASFKGEARVESLELLWDKFFGDFKDQKPFFKVDGTYQRAADELRFNLFHILLDTIGHLGLKGSVRHFLSDPLFNLDIQTDDFRPAGFYDLFVRDAFKTTHPIFERIGTAGKSNVAIRAQGSLESFTVEGRLRLQQGEIRERSGRWRVGPVTLDLPLRLHFPHAQKENIGELPPVGKVSVQGIKTASTTVPEISGAIILWNNSLRFPEAIRVSLFGGTCVIGKLAWQDVIGSPKELSFSLQLDDLRLLDLTEALGWYRFGGNLSGAIPDVRWTGDSLKSAGAIALDVFGGRVTIGEMEIEKPLSPVRSIKMDARIEGIDLEQASETFEFGRISGVLAGTIEDLVITRGQPAEFKADIHTVEKPGVSQWISVEALNKITVLSSGNEAGSIYGGIAGFFDFFRYSKLGFKAVLKNDKMALRGIETKNNQEYLVVGTLLPPTVNIISHTQEIGFSELLRRLERVQKKESPKSSAHPYGGIHG